MVKMNPESIVLISCTELRCTGPVISIFWRLYVDNLLSTTLVKFENIYGALLKLNLVVDVKRTAVWLIAGGLIFDYVLHSFILVNHQIISTQLKLSFVEKVGMSF